jgi:phosphodiesterase/alkaline phosphatase D-like protein
MADLRTYPAADPPAGDRPLTGPTAVQQRQVLLLGALILAATVTSALAAFAEPAADDRLDQLIRDWGWIDGLSWLDSAQRLPVLAGLAALIFLGARCRTFLAVAAGTLVAGCLAGWLLSALVARPRPIGWTGAGTDSYPSVPLLVLTMLAGLVPMALESLTGKLLVRHLASAMLGFLVLGAGLAKVHTGARWPLDVVGAVVLGWGFVLVARIFLEEPSRHRWCHDCLWQARAATARPVAPTVIDLTSRRVRMLHRVTLVWVAGVVAVYAVLAVTRGLPRSPESGVMGTGLEVPLQWTLLGLIVCGVLLARRWHLFGAVLVAFAAGLLGYASSVEYAPLIAVTIAAVAWLPALLLWLEWHRRVTLRAALAAAAATSLMLGVVVSTAALTYAAYWGPTHPESATAAPDMSTVEWMWSGGVTSTGAVLRVRMAADTNAVRVLVGTNRDLSSPEVIATARPDRDRVAGVQLQGLRPDTRYYYAAEIDGERDGDRVQSFRTFPEGAASFSFAIGACQPGGSNGQVFDAIRATDPLFFLAMGDWTYGNINRNDASRFQAQYDLNLTAPAQVALYAQAPVAYVWDDHDYGGNDADRTSPSRPAAMRTYRQMTPHYPLAGDAETPIYQAFTVGRVRFVMTDNRSDRDPPDDVSGPYRTSLGTEQRAWLLGELARADSYGLVVWMNSDPWIGRASPGSDTWAGFAEERRVIADVIAERHMDNLLMVSGDAHMLAFDDGTHTDYSTSHAGGFPLLHAAAIDRPGNRKGGPYSGPVIPGGGQFATVDVHDDGTTIAVTLTGRRWDSQQLFSRELQFPQR